MVLFLVRHLCLSLKHVHWPHLAGAMSACRCAHSANKRSTTLCHLILSRSSMSLPACQSAGSLLTVAWLLEFFTLSQRAGGLQILDRLTSFRGFFPPHDYSWYPQVVNHQNLKKGSSLWRVTALIRMIMMSRLVTSQCASQHNKGGLCPVFLAVLAAATERKERPEIDVSIWVSV